MAADESLTMWPKEIIPDASLLFMRVHKSLVSNGEILPNFFREQGGAMSVDWNKHSTPVQSQLRAKVPSDNAIIQMNTGMVRKIQQLMVDHDPIQEGSIDAHGRPVAANRAHSLVTGVKRDPQRRVQLSRISEWVIRI